MHIVRLIFGSVISLVTLASAQVPQMINYQGRVAVGDPAVNFNGTGLFWFALVNGGINSSQQATGTAVRTGGFITSVSVTNGGSGYASAPTVSFSGGGGVGAEATAIISSDAVTSIVVTNAGSGYTSAPTVTITSPPDELSFASYWSNDGTSTDGSEPTGAVSLPVTKGLYSVLLGANMTPIPNTVFANPDVHLRVWFDDGTNGSQLLTPDQRIAAVGYAMVASTVPDGAITSDKLSSGLTLKGTTSGTFSGDGSGLTNIPANLQALNDLAAALAADPDLENYFLQYEPKKNLIRPSYITAGKYYSPGSGQVVTSGSWRSVGWVPVVEGVEYTVSGTEAGMSFYTATGPNDTGETYTSVGGTGGPTFTIPAGHTHLWINLTNDGQAATTYDGTVQLEVGDTATAYEPYELGIGLAQINADLQPAIDLAADSSTIPRMELVTSKNLIDPDAIDYARRYSTGTQTAATDTLGIAAVLVPVDEGETYSVSGNDGVYGGTSTPQGGYYTSSTYVGVSAVSNIAWVDVTGGHTFTVPVGQSITHAMVSLRKLNDDSASTSLNGEAQIEKAALPTAYEAYVTRYVVAEANLPDAALEASGGGSTPTNAEIDGETWYKYTEGEPSPSNRDKWPLFRTKYLKKQEDVVVVSTGTSLTARTTEHHSIHVDASTRPPLMHSNNLATHIWDRLKWDGQYYARYDATGQGLESSGTWITDHDAAEWDDGLYRNGLTRYSDSVGATFTREVPVGAYAWRLIYRTDSLASEDVLVTISGGNDRMQVYDESTSDWVEANAHSFSMREAAPVARDVPVPKPDLGTIVTRNIATKGNTTYQKRLKFRCRAEGSFDTRSIAKTVTFTANGAGRLLYWGHEWSKRPAMITYINAARGSHNTQVETVKALPKFADNEVHGFEPDLIYMEIPIHNDGAAGATAYPTHDRWERLVNDYVFRQDYELSLKRRAADLGYPVPEIGMWTPSIAVNFNGLDPDGEFVFADNSDGVVNNALDRFDWAQAWVMDNHPEAVFVNSVRRWVTAGRAIYGDLRTATIASSKTGPTMTNDGSHPNDIGSAILAKVVVGPFCYWQ